MLNHLNTNRYENQIIKHRLRISVNRNLGYRSYNRSSRKLDTHLAFGVRIKGKPNN